MNKQKILLLIGIIVAVALIGFFLTKTPVNKDVKQPCTTSTSTDCLMPTPAGTSYYVPPKEESLATTTQSGKIDEHLTINNELRDVNFCGNMNKVKQVIIDGVDVVQRIAELITKSQIDYEKEICRMAGSGNEIGISEVVNNTYLGNNIYKVDLVYPTGGSHIGDFRIDITTGNIFIAFGGFGDEDVKKLVGKLK